MSVSKSWAISVTRLVTSEEDRGLTLVADEVDFSPVPGDAQSMILHAGAPANVAQDENLDVFVGWILGCAPTAGDASPEAAAKPSERPDAIV